MMSLNRTEPQPWLETVSCEAAGLQEKMYRWTERIKALHQNENYEDQVANPNHQNFSCLVFCFVSLANNSLYLMHAIRKKKKKTR